MNSYKKDLINATPIKHPKNYIRLDSYDLVFIVNAYQIPEQ